MTSPRTLRALGAFAALLGFAASAPLAGCGGNEAAPGDATAPCDPIAQTGCEAGLVCESVVGGASDGGAPVGCFAPVRFEGRVTRDEESGAPGAGAYVVARDENGVATADGALTAADGSYSLRVPAPRDAAGVPVASRYTLRVDAQGYESFPGALRVPLPIDVREATAPGYAVANAATSIVLFSSERPTATAIIRGRVEAPSPGGTLVVTDGTTAIADRSGAFTLFNVEPGARVVRGFAAGVQLDATVNAGADAPAQAVWRARDRPLASVGGSVNIVNAPGGSRTSVVLAVEETFVAALERGEVPRGLRAGDVSGAFRIDGVPDGRYVVLAAFENDGLVRDPDPGIAGTQVLRFEAKGGAVDAGTFKVTGALAVTSPGRDAPQGIRGAPTFVWADDSSETGYHLHVYDSRGTTLWEKLDIPSVKGSATVQVPYGGPALMPGRYYQFRATSVRSGAPIARTEELRGVFQAQ